MKYLSFISFILLLAGCSTTRFNTETNNQLSNTTAISNEELIKHLSSDDLEGREPGSPGMEKATVYVENFLATMKIKPLFDNSYRDSLKVKGKEAYNVVGVLPGNKQSNEYVLIGAHLDHLGKINSKTDSVYNGANDNASGVLAVLKIAEELKKTNHSRHVIVALFTGEESGLLGSAHLAKRLKKQNIKLKYVINFDMIGSTLTDKPGKVYITGYKRTDFAEKSNELLKEEFIVHERADDYYNLFYMSDNYPFYSEFNIPAHTISTYDFKNFREYHRVGDEYSKLDIENLNSIIGSATTLISKLLNTNTDIGFADRNDNNIIVKKNK
ncbi:MAG: M20/M25/M40 family metallo-hydrolase [Bacteroidota bacterium]